MSTSDEFVRFEPARSLQGSVQTPGDKSISHRALLLGALSPGVTTIEGLSSGDDVGRTRRIIEQLGAVVLEGADGLLSVSSSPDSLHASSDSFDCGNSGTTIRLAMGVVAGIVGHHVFIGDESLSARPMDRVADPLRQMGSSVSGSGKRETCPITIDGQDLKGISYTMPVPSAQVKSAILLAALNADGPTVVLEPTPTRTHTEEMLKRSGAKISIETTTQGKKVTMLPSNLEAQHWRIPADPSNAAFFVVAGQLGEHSSVACEGIYGGAERIGFVSVLDRMGANLECSFDSDATMTVVSSSHQLHGTDIAASEIPSLDEIPILTVAACAATGKTHFFDAGELRLKESDRFEACLSLARSLGATAWSEGSTIGIEGLTGAENFLDFEFDAKGDHRLAMAAAIAASVGNGGSVKGMSSISTNYPTFITHLSRLA